MSDLLKEIQDDMRRERAENMWRNFGRQAVGISIAVVLGTIGAVGWKSYQSSENTAMTSLLVTGLNRMEVEDYKGALAAFEEASRETSDPKYGIAMLRKAELQRKTGDLAAAQETYRALAASGGKHEAFAALAAMLAAKEEVIAEPAKGAPYYHLQREWRAWQLVDQDKKDEAVAIFTALNDDAETPVPVRGRAAEALQLLAPDALLAHAEGAADAAP